MHPENLEQKMKTFLLYVVYPKDIIHVLLMKCQE